MPEILWAPWRMTYVERPTTGTDKSRNIFVELPAEANDRENLILFRGDKAFVILNKFPYSNGHLLVAPYRQSADLDSLDDSELLEINQLLVRAVRWLKLAFQPDGFNVGINLGKSGGAGIPQHIHWHVVPRWAGDTNFMTVVGETRVIPVGMDECYERLAEAIRQNP